VFWEVNGIYPDAIASIVPCGFASDLSNEFKWLTQMVVRQAAE
jgi:hypothetical protein